MTLWKLLLVGVLIHLIFLKAIFDIYFTSPLVHGMQPQQITSQSPPPAKRLVLISCDGLRADKFFADDIWMPFVRRMAAEQGSSGISQTHVPTESRPGHVAMIAGFYEDVSAVTKGWKENPVEFDSVFNQSRFTWGWGSPDIIPIFTKIKNANGTSENIPHIFAQTYSSEFEDFAANPIQLDFWVFYQITDFLHQAKSNTTLMGMLQQDRIIFFLHLLGMDTTGHVFKPQSSVYTDNMRKVDGAIRTFADQLNAFYNHDEQTAFVFTSDHGMTDWGSHGSGQMDETATPIVVWGAGVEIWKRKDIQQADLAPLMSALIGIPIPANSVGVLPLIYLKASEYYKNAAFLTNAKQIFQQVRILMELKQGESFSVFFKEFPKMNEYSFAKKLSELDGRLNHTNIELMTDEIAELIQLSLQALEYYQTYDRPFLQFVVVLGYGGWMLFIVGILLKGSTKTSVNAHSQLKTVKTGAFAGLGVFVILLVQGSPKIHILYALLPVFTWTSVFLQLPVFQQFLKQSKDQRLRNGISIASATHFLLGIELLVLAFFFRPAISAGLIASGWWVRNQFPAPLRMRTAWLISSSLLSLFPLLPVVGKSRHIALVLLTGLLGFIALCVVLKKFQSQILDASRLLKIQAGLLLISMIVVYLTGRNVDQQLSPGLFIHGISWTLLLLGFLLPFFFGSTRIILRFLNVAVSLLTSYLLMSVAYEALFFLIFAIHMYLWIELESVHQNSSKFRMMTIGPTPIFLDTRPMNLEDIRRAFFFVFFILAAFFGTGNIASINSFDPASAFCFVTVFKPFVMGAVLLCKIMIPFLLIGCAFHLIHVMCRVPIRGICLIVMLISDLMALHFFFLVKTEGSWLDIGTSISHYVMVMTLIVVTSLLSYLSSLLMSNNNNILWRFK